MNTDSQRQFLSLYTLWLLPAMAGVVLTIFGLVVMTIRLEHISSLTLRRVLGFLVPVVAGCGLIALSVGRFHKRRLAIRASSQAPELSLNHQKRWLWFAPLSLSIMVAGGLLFIYWGIPVIHEDLLWAPICCISILVSIYFSFFFIRHWDEYPSPDHWKVLKRCSVVFVILWGAAVALIALSNG